MHSARLISIITLALLAGCPDAGLDMSTTGGMDPLDMDSASSTSTPEVTTGAEPPPVPGFDCSDPWQVDEQSLSELCEAFPFARAVECYGEPFSCPDLIVMIAGTPACSEVTPCDYQACSAALAVAECNERPDECDEIADCLDPPEPEPEPDCCDLHGKKPGTGLCEAGLEPFCTDCDGKPALCMTEGCGSANVEDCCLSDAGETVACPPPVCSPGFCDDFETVGIADGLDPEFAEELGKICKWNPCFACGEVAKGCVAAQCPGLTAKCEAELATCDCG